MSQIAQYRGTGKRKTSVARVILRPGDGLTWFNSTPDSGQSIDNLAPGAPGPLSLVLQPTGNERRRKRRVEAARRGLRGVR